MIKLWLSNKFRFFSHVGCFLSGLTALVLPWYIFLVIFAISLLFDYIAFSFEYTSE